MTIPELLSTKMFRGNQSFLTRELGVNRGTLRKYMNDTKGEFHYVRQSGEDYELFVNQTNKAND